MKDLMANTVGTVELQQLKQKHEQKVNHLRLTSPICARPCSPSPLLSSLDKLFRHLSLTPYPHPALMWMTRGGGTGGTGVGSAVHLPPCWLHWSVWYIYVIEVVRNLFCHYILVALLFSFWCSKSLCLLDTNVFPLSSCWSVSSLHCLTSPLF